VAGHVRHRILRTGAGGSVSLTDTEPLDAGQAHHRRLFVAVELPPAIRRAASARAHALAGRQLPVRWEADEKLHITLCFPGAVPASRLEQIVAALAAATGRQRAIALALGQLGQLPPHGPPRVVGLGVDGDVDGLRQLRAGLVERLEVMGVRDDRAAFVPHITLGRVARRATPREARTVSGAIREVADRVGTRWTVEAITLFESLPAEGTTRYVRVESFPLGLPGG
jgi:RNA 2',3'-cyclic 3'-phosphodiesterase